MKPTTIKSNEKELLESDSEYSVHYKLPEYVERNQSPKPQLNNR